MAVRKYLQKYSPEVTASRLGQVSGIARERLTRGATETDNVRKIVTPILDQYGIGGGQRGTYISFALMLASRVAGHSQQVASKIAIGLVDYFVQSYGLDYNICTELVHALGIKIPVVVIPDEWEVGEWEVSSWVE